MSSCPTVTRLRPLHPALLPSLGRREPAQVSPTPGVSDANPQGAASPQPSVVGSVPPEPPLRVDGGVLPSPYGKVRLSRSSLPLVLARGHRRPRRVLSTAASCRKEAATGGSSALSLLGHLGPSPSDRVPAFGTRCPLHPLPSPLSASLAPLTCFSGSSSATATAGTHVTLLLCSSSPPPPQVLPFHCAAPPPPKIEPHPSPLVITSVWAPSQASQRCISVGTRTGVAPARNRRRVQSWDSPSPHQARVSFFSSWNLSHRWT